MAKGIIIDIGVNADVDEGIQHIKKQFDSLEKTVSNIDLSKDLKKELSSLKIELSKVMKEVSDSIEEISLGKVNNKDFEKFKKTTQNKFSEINKDIVNLQKDFQNFQALLQDVDGSSTVSQVTKISNSLNDLESQLSGTITTMTQLFELVGNGKSNISITNGFSVEELKKELSIYKSILQEIDQLGNASHGYAVKDDSKIVADIISTYQDYYDTIEKIESVEDNESLSNKSKEQEILSLNKKYVELSVTIDNLINRFVEIKGLNGFDFQIEGIDLSSIQHEMSEGLQNIKQEAKAKIDSINSVLSNTDVQSFNLKDGKISVPLRISTTPSKITEDALEIINIAQNKVSRHPIACEIKLVSGYKTSRNSELQADLSLLKKQIDQIEDGSDKEHLLDLYNNINKQFGKEIRLDINTNIEETKKSVNAGIKAIQKELDNAYLLIRPKIEIDEKSQKELQDQVQHITDEFSLNVSKEAKQLSQSLQTALKKETVDEWAENFSKNITTLSQEIDNKISFGKVFEKTPEIESFFNEINEINKGLENKSIKLDISNEGSIEKIISSLTELSNLLRVGFNISSQNDLDNKWVSMTQHISQLSSETNGLNLNMNKTKSGLKEIMSEYDEYYKMGGRNPFSSLSDQSKISKKLDNYYIQHLQEQKNIEQELTNNTVRDNQLQQESYKELIVILDELQLKLSNVLTEVNNTFDNDQLNVRIQSTYEILKTFTQSVNDLKIDDSNILTSINSIIQKGDELENLVKILGSDGIAGKIVSIEDTINPSDDFKILEDIFPSDKEFANIIDNLNLMRSELVDIVKVSRQGHRDKDTGKFLESIVLTDSNGSTETYGESSHSQKGQLLTYNYIRKDNTAQQQEKELYEELSSAIEKYSTVKKRIAKNKSFEGDVELAEQLKKKIDDLQKEPILSSKHLNDAKNKLTKLNDELDDIKASLNSSIESKLKTINIDGNELDSYQINDIGRIQEQYLKWGLSIDETEDKLKELKSAHKDLVDAGGIDERIEAEQKYQAVLQETKNELKATKQLNASPNRIISELNALNNWLGKNSLAAKEYGDEFAILKERLQNGIGQLSNEDLDQITKRIREIKVQATLAGKTGSTMIDLVKDRAKQLAVYLSTFVSFYDIIRYLREGIKIVREFDTALTEMRKVSDESLETLQKYQKETFDIGDSVGATAKTVQDSTADWLRLGESMDEAKKSAKSSSVLFNVSEFENINEATESLVSMSQAYRDLDKNSIIDKLNNIGNNYSIATDDLARGMQNAAAALKTQGNDLDEAIALVTAGNAVVQDISKASTGTRTISLRIAGTKEAKDQLAELGEDVDDFVVQTESKTQQTIKDYTAVASNGYQGVDVLDANGNLRNTYQILLDISKIYKEIQEEDKKAGTNRASALVEYIAGEFCLRIWEHIQRTCLIAGTP